MTDIASSHVPATACGSSEVEGHRLVGPDTLGELAALGWDDLLAEHDLPDPCRRIGWLDAWQSTHPHAATPYGYAIMRDGRLTAAVALEITRQSGVRLVRYFAAEGACFALDPPARDAESREALLRMVARAPGDLLVLEGVTAGSSTEIAIRTALPRALIEPTQPSFRADLVNPSTALQKHRTKMARSWERAAKREPKLTVLATRDWNAIRERIPDILDFHLEHFPVDRFDELAADGPHRDFTEAGLQVIGASGDLHLTELHAPAGTLVAFELSLIAGPYAVGFAKGYDRTRRDIRDLGWLAVDAAMTGLAGHGVRTLDVGPGAADSDKSRLGDLVPRVRVVLPLTPTGRVALGAYRLKRRFARRHAKPR